MFGLLVKVVGNYAVDLGSVPGSKQVKQNSDVEQKLQILQIWDFLKLKIFNPILKFANRTAGFSHFGVLATAMQCAKPPFVKL